MRNIRINKEGPRMTPGPFPFLQRGSRMRFIDDDASNYHPSQIVYYSESYDFDWNKWSRVWETSTPMCNASEVKMIIEIETKKTMEKDDNQ